MTRRKFYQYEGRGEPLASRRIFLRRMGAHLTIGLAIICIALLAGMAGCVQFGNLLPVDAFLFSSMILSGMGPTGEIANDSMKVFAGIYALVCGLLFYAVAGLTLAPILHRVLHVFHADDKD